MEQKKQTHIMYGFVTGIIMVAISLILYLTGLAFKGKGIQYVSQIPFLVGIILNARAYSKANEGFVTFGNVFGSGFKLSMIVALVMVVWSVIMIYAMPEMKEKTIEMARAQLAKDPRMTDDTMDLSISMMKKYWSVIILSTAIFGTMIYGAIFSLIGGAVAEKKGERLPMSDF